MNETQVPKGFEMEQERRMLEYKKAKVQDLKDTIKWEKEKQPILEND